MEHHIRAPQLIAMDAGTVELDMNDGDVSRTSTGRTRAPCGAAIDWDI